MVIANSDDNMRTNINNLKYAWA